MTINLEKEEKSVVSPASIWTRNFILLCLANFVLFMSTQMLFPSLPGYISAIGGNQKDVGYVMGAYTISSMVMRPFAGWLVDSRGRKFSLTLGMVMMLSAALLYIIGSNIPVLTLIRCLHGFAFGLVTTAISTIVVDSLPISRLSEGMGYFGLTSSLSMSVSPIVGFSLVGLSGYHTLFFAVSGLTILAFSASIFVHGANGYMKTSAASFKSIGDNLWEKSALLPSGTMFLLAAVYGSVLSYISLYAAESGISNIGLFFSVMAIMMLASRSICGRWADRGGVNKVLLIGHLGLFIGMSSIALSHNIWQFIGAGTFIGIGFGVSLPTLQAQAVRYSSVQRRGAATGTFFAAMDLGTGTGTILWGYVASVVSYQFMYALTLLPILLAGLIYFKFNSDPSRLPCINPRQNRQPYK